MIVPSSIEECDLLADAVIKMLQDIKGCEDYKGKKKEIQKYQQILDALIEVRQIIGESIDE
tara:strand:- start:3027 stop:3209 length:183 start_codon:yes stop_codon:yes gene_type:complete